LSAHAHASFVVVSLLVTLFALWVLHTWSTATVPWLARRRRAVALGLAAFVVVDRCTDLIVVHQHNAAAGVAHAAFVLVMTTLILSAIPVALIHAAARTGEPKLEAPPVPARTGEPKLEAPPVPAPSTSNAMTRRQVVEGLGGTAVFAATGSMLGWGMVVGRHAFELVDVPLRIPGLPRVLDGYVIAQVSDLHTGAFIGERELEEGLSLVRRARPDLVVVTGDVVDFDPVYAPLAARRLAELPARDGVTAILGNHDQYAGGDKVTAALRGAGVDVMRNTGKVVRPGDGGGFALLGVDDVSFGRRGDLGPRLDLALAAVAPDLPRILLSHQPVTVDLWPGRVAAQLSGHTHGGQINPGFSPLGLLMKYVAGAYSVGGTTLYVNRGFGTVGAPSRIGAPPEVTRFVLVAA
jgi:predicted MPP superfamily phosphohydrolase